MENQIPMGVLQRDAVDFNKNKVLNICTLLFATGIHRYLNFRKLAHVAFCKQTLQLLYVVPGVTWRAGVDLAQRYAAAFVRP